LNLDDPALRAPTWWELIRYRDRFPTIDDMESPSPKDSPAPKAVNQN
jgi:hypothetical protein